MGRVCNALWVFAVFGALVGCHADADDPAGQAGELSDPVRRHNAIANITKIYTRALADAEGDRSNEDVKKVADATVEKLVATYIDYPEDNRAGREIMSLFEEMRDPRSLPALLEALKWRTGVNEQHAEVSARTLRFVEIPEDKKGDVIEGLGESLGRITTNRGEDNRMREQFIRTLGALQDSRATPALSRVITTQNEAQDFLFNRLAAMQLAEIGDEAAIDVLIKALFIFDPARPNMRMNDVGAAGLVRIGRPAYDPLVALLRGENEEANALVTTYIAAVRQVNEEAASRMSVEQLVGAEATFALGALGYGEALEAIKSETDSEDMGRKVNGAISLVRLNLSANDLEAVRTILRDTYQAVPLEMKPQLLAAMRHLYDSALMPFFLEQAKDQELHTQVRNQAVAAFALLANAEEARQMQALIEEEPEPPEGAKT
ncbi:MAG: HEAT repeat domain-containing protein, partial [Myxococcota bacterium]